MRDRFSDGKRVAARLFSSPMLPSGLGQDRVRRRTAYTVRRDT